MSNLAELFGNNVRAQRKALGISQEHLADLAGLDRSYMSRIERGKVSVTLQKVYQIVTVLECELKDVLPAIESVDLWSDE